MAIEQATSYDAGGVYRREEFERIIPGNTPAHLMNRYKQVVNAAIQGNPSEVVANMPGFSPRVAAWNAYSLDKRMEEVKKITSPDEIKALLTVEPINVVLQALVQRKVEIDPDPSIVMTKKA